MRETPGLLVTALALTLTACSAGDADVPTAEGSAARLDAHGGRFENHANGGYHFTVPEDFNGGIFGGEVGNRVAFTAKRDAAGSVSGHYHYHQTFQGETFTFSGPVTCFRVYDTPTLQRFPEIPPMTGNRAKWGGRIDASNDPTIPPGTFIWFQSIDNGEGAKSPPDLSTLSGFGDEAANEAFCASDAVPNPNFGPHAVQGNIQVR